MGTDLPKPTHSGQRPNLVPGEYAVVRVEVSTGIVLRADGSRADIGEPVWIVFDSLDAARQFSISDVAAHPSVECNIWGSQKDVERIRNEGHVENIIAEAKARRAARPRKWWRFWKERP